MLDQVAAPAAQRVALVAGATGLVGREVLAGLLADKRYGTVHSVGRRPAAAQHAKLSHHVLELSSAMALADIVPIDDVFICLGTTIRAAGSRAAFRAVDLEAVVALARAARTAGANRLAVVSAMGADVNSRVFYNRVKGEMESALCGLGYRTLVIARPSLLSGDRHALGQASRAGETVGSVLMAVFKPLIPLNWQVIAASKVARAMLNAVQHTGQGTRILLSGELQRSA